MDEMHVNEIHVVKRGDLWVGDSVGEVVVTALSQEEAVRRVDEIAREEPSPLLVRVHDEDGNVVNEHIYPNESERAHSSTS